MNESLLNLLREGKIINPLVVIDPFKIGIDEAKEKVIFLRSIGVDLIILSSTDFYSLKETLVPYIVELKKASDIKVIINFPPDRFDGYLILDEANGTILSHILNSEEIFYKSGCFDISKVSEGKYDNVGTNIITCGGLSFGIDEKSKRWVSAIPTDKTESSLATLVTKIRMNKYDLVYLFSRYEGVDTEICRYFRQHMYPDQLLIVSGRFSCKKRIETYLQNGANYIVCGGVFEVDDWRNRMLDLFGLVAIEI
jgi:heptaprenylglyceryl phosphate synthase